MEKHYPKFQPNSNGIIEYNTYVNTMSLKEMTPDIQASFSKAFNTEIHPWIKRGLYFSSRHLEELITAKTQRKPIFLLSELKPNNRTSLDLSEIIHYSFIKWFQDISQCNVIIMIADDEESSEKTYTPLQIRNHAREKIKNILSLDLNPLLTHAFYNHELRINNNYYESFVSQLKMKITYGRLIELFDYNDEVSISKLDYPCYIASAVNPQIYNGLIDKDALCLIPTQINNVNRYKLSNDANAYMGISKPSLIVSQIVPPLTGITGKDCFTDIEHTVLLSDDDKTIKKKIMKHSLSGSRGNGSLEDHQKLGGNVDVDISIKYLEYFENDETELNEIKAKFAKGEISCGEVKQILVDIINDLFAKIKVKQSIITNEVIDSLFVLKK